MQNNPPFRIEGLESISQLAASIPAQPSPGRNPEARFRMTSKR
jgi:hypothetical protein